VLEGRRAGVMEPPASPALTGPLGPVVLVSPVYGNEATLPALAQRIAAALPDRRWRLRLVIDASPDASLAVARAMTAADDRIAVTALTRNVGQHQALLRGLAAEAAACAWVCLDADLQDPPEAVPGLLHRLADGDAGAVFAGRRGRYESVGRRATGAVHRAALATLMGLPPDAGAFVAMARPARDAVVRLGAPSIVAAIGAARVPAVSVPVARSARSSGSSGWRSRDRLRQSARTLAWATRMRCHPGRAGSHR
jgi:hypothetical protein